MNVDLKRFVRWLKERNPCKDCGRFYHYSCMEFDHLPEKGKKVGTVGQIVDSGDETALCEEIDKCDIVCMICHRYRTMRRGISAETRRRMSEAQKGRKLPLKTRKKMKAAQREMREQRRGPFKEFPKASIDPGSDHLSD